MHRRIKASVISKGWNYKSYALPYTRFFTIITAVFTVGASVDYNRVHTTS